MLKIDGKKKYFRQMGYKTVQPGEFKEYAPDSVFPPHYPSFSTDANGICQHEDLDLDVVSCVASAKHVHLHAVNGVCSGRCIDVRRQSAYEKVSVMTFAASIERRGDRNCREIVWVIQPERKARIELFDPTKRSKAYIHAFTCASTTLVSGLAMSAMLIEF